MRLKWIWMACMITGLTGCDGKISTDPLITDASTLYSRLELNHKNIVLSVYAPYDTVQLRAFPRSLAGDTLPYTDSLQFLKVNPSDTSVHLDPSGLVTAHTSTSATQIEVRLTVNGITWSDTAVIMVRNEFPVRRIARLEYFPVAPDSSRYWASLATAIQPNRWLRLYDADNRAIPLNQALVNFTWDDPAVFGRTVAPGDYNARVIGETYVYARTYAYGMPLADSFLFRRVDPPLKFIVINSVFPANAPATISFAPGELRIRRGTTVVFMNRFGASLSLLNCRGTFCQDRIPHITETGNRISTLVDSVDIQFDDPAKAGVGDSYGRTTFAVFLTASYPSDGGAGNIGAFALHMCETKVGADAACNGVTNATLDPGYRMRKFDVSGTIHYTSSRFPGARGTIVVEE